MGDCIDTDEGRLHWDLFSFLRINPQTVLRDSGKRPDDAWPTILLMDQDRDPNGIGGDRD